MSDAGAAPSLSDRATRPRLGPRFVAVTIAATLFLRLPGFVHRLFDPDEAAIAVQSMAMIRGGHLYTDVIDRKPPLAVWLYAAVFRTLGSNDLRPVRVLVALSLAGAALLIGSELLRRHDRRVAIWGVALFVVGVVAFAPQDAQSANFSPLALLPGVGAIVAARRGTRRATVLAGLLVGVATLTRQSWAIGIVPAMWAAWYFADTRDLADHQAAHRRSWRRVPAEFVAAARAGGVIPLQRSLLVLVVSLLTVAAVGLTVPLRLFVVWVFTGNGSLLLGLSDSTGAAVRAGGSLLLFAVGHLALGALLLRRGWDRPLGRRWADADLWLWLATALVSVVAGFRFFGHYWMQALPPLCLLAAPAIDRCTDVTRRVLVGVLALTTGVFAALAWVPGWLHPLPDARPLSAFVRSHSARSDKVAVWGSYPEVYWESDRMPAGGLVHTDFVVGKSAGRIESSATVRDADPEVVRDYVHALEAAPPELFIDTSTADLRDYGRYPVSVLPELAALLQHRYTRVAVINGVTVYQRTGPAPPTPEWLRD